MKQILRGFLAVLLFAAHPLMAEEARDSVPVVTPQEAAQYDGKLVTVRGVVDAQRDSQKGITYLNFGGKFPNQTFTCLLKPKNFGGAPGAYAGKTVEVTGLIQMHEGKPSMDLAGADKIKVVEEAAAGEKSEK